jgi:hypothetical protein
MSASARVRIVKESIPWSSVRLRYLLVRLSSPSLFRAIRLTHFQCKSAVQKWIEKCGGCPVGINLSHGCLDRAAFVIFRSIEGNYATSDGATSSAVMSSTGICSRESKQVVHFGQSHI